jgi:hypothetical protein
VLSALVWALAMIAGLAPAASARGSNPLAVRGMWIWEMPSSNRGNLSSIVARARRYGIRTLLIKSGDGTNYWSQFSRSMVSTMHRNKLKVCAWQYVYGNSPASEARVGAQAVRNGADCLMIDAESEYEGKYISAQTYIRTLRGLIGSRFPVALAGFPYVDYHAAFPYSVFLGPGAAQYNAPQMYWVDIGTSVDRVFAHTYAFNRLYGRTIFPLGQIYNAPPLKDIRRFRQMCRAYHAPNASWWDWQEASGGSWSALSQRLASLSNFQADTSYASVGQGAKGDVVVWAQEHLVSAGQRISIDGDFGAQTKAAVKRFQRAHRLTADGLIGTSTWAALLRYSAARVTWARGGARIALAASRGTLAVPKSARLPAKANELHGAPGRGRPRS